MKMTKIVPLVLGGVLCVAYTVPAWVGATVREGDTKKESRVVKKYPPYPDVWSTKGIVGTFCAADNGEFYILSRPGDRPGEGLDTWKLVAFFGESMSEISSEKAMLIRDADEPLPNVGMLQCMKGGDLKEHEKKYAPLVLPNGVTIRLACIGGDQFGRSCEYPYFGHGLEARDQEGHIIAHKTVLYMPKTPRQQYLEAPRISEDGGEIRERVIRIEPDLIPLKDGSFLVNTGRGIMRLDHELNMHAKNKVDNVFLVETRRLDDIYEQLFGPKGGPGQMADFQALQDATANLLRKMKKGTHP